MSKEVRNLKQAHQQLVTPVCALEEYCNTSGVEVSPIVETIAIALRKVLNDIEAGMNKE